jgi:hypothetical protein
MDKMVSVGCPSLSWAIAPFEKKSGQLMTRHNGQILPRRGTCTRIEECRRSSTLTISNIIKSEVIDKGTVEKG